MFFIHLLLVLLRQIINKNQNILKTGNHFMTPLIINSLIETNLGMPIIYVIFHFFRNRWNEDLTKVVNVKETHEESERKGADK